MHLREDFRSPWWSIMNRVCFPLFPVLCSPTMWGQQSSSFAENVPRHHLGAKGRLSPDIRPTGPLFEGRLTVSKSVLYKPFSSTYSVTKHPHWTPMRPASEGLRLQIGWVLFVWILSYTLYNSPVFAVSQNCSCHKFGATKYFSLFPYHSVPV